MSNKLSLSANILSDITVYMKYARYIPEIKRRETWEEICERNMAMHIRKYPMLKKEIQDVYHRFIMTKKVLPSMRSLQFGGVPIELSPNRIFNCAYLPVDSIYSFSETMFLLLGGTGCGYSVQRHHVEKLPAIKGTLKTNRRFLVGDSIEGWADAIKVLFEAYFHGKSNPVFDYRDIRPKGAMLITSGGKAPGPQPLKDAIHNIKKVLDSKPVGSKLLPIEAHDIMCFIADAVLAGGIRRAALISLFSMDDEDMLTCKHGSWWESNPQRGRANNSAVIIRHMATEDSFFSLWEKVVASHSGEPGVYFSNDKDWGTNPSLRKGTKVLTTEGIFPIEELDGKEFTVKNLHGQLSKAKCWLSGRGKKLFKVTLTGGHEYYATAEHEWPIWNGEKYVKVKTPDIAPRSKMPIIRETSLFEGTKGTRSDGFMLGWLLGDGWTGNYVTDVTTRHSFIVSDVDRESGICDMLEEAVRPFSDSKFHQDYRSENIEDEEFMVVQQVRQQTSTMQVTNKSFSAYIDTFGFANKTEGLPKCVWSTATEEFRKGIIDGLFSSDGHVEKNAKRITLTAKHEKLVRDVSELLGFYGIKTSIRERVTKLNGKEYPGFSLNIEQSASIKHFRDLFKLTCTHKQQALDAYDFRYKITDEDTITVIGVEETELYEDVWDISVFDETHCFQLAHTITGNCCEIALRPYQFCNLCELNVSDIESQEDLNERARAAAFVGTLQAGYTDFHYLRDVWKQATEKDALIGVGMTGIGSGAVLHYDLKEAANVVKEENKRVAEIIGINVAARSTTVKPAGTSSCVLGSASGIHAWHNTHYIRRIRVGKNESIYPYLAKNHPELVEDEYFRPTEQAVIQIPQAAPAGSILRTEDPMQLLERVKRFNIDWVKSGHRKGPNTHNVSCTISVKDDEWEKVGKWMWENRNNFNGISVLPYDGGTYIQAPFEDISEERYHEMMTHLTAIDLTKVIEEQDNTNLTGEAACAGGQCEVK